MTETKNSILKGAHYCEKAFSDLIPLEGHNGFVFGVLHSLGAKESFDILSGIIHSHLERLSTTVEPGANLTHRFEQLLQALNEDIAQGVDEGLFSLPISDTSSVIGVASGNAVVVSGFGNLLAEFMHKSEKEQYDIYDLSRGMRVEEEMPSWKKLFLTVLDGEVRSGDVLYVGTRVSRHDLPATTLNEIITTLPPNSAVSKIRQYLPIETVFAAVVIKNDSSEEPTRVSEDTARASLERLDKTAARTDRYLSEQKPEMKSIGIKLWLFLFPKRGSAERRKMLKKLARFAGRLLVVFVTVAVQILFGLAKAGFVSVKRVVSNPKQIRQNAKKAKEKIDRGIRTGIARFNVLPKTSKYVLLALLTVGVLLVGGIILINRQQAGATERQAYEQTVSAAQKKIENAEASLIYGDENQARTLLNDAWQLINNLSTSNAERKKTVEDLQTQISAKRDTLRHVVQVEIKQVADGGGLTGESFSAVVALAGKWYGLTDQANVYAIDAGTETMVKLEVTKGDVGAPLATSPGETAIYWLDNGLTRYTPESGEVAPLSVSRNGVDLQYYGGKMYILSPETGQVYKHQRTASGFDGGSAWIISGVSSVTDGIALTIDGYLWILKSDGSILRYLAGKETDWKVGVVEPSLLSAKDIWTDEASKYLYVLDAAGKRVVVFDKDKGTLVVQYENEAFSDLKSMIVDEVNKKISVLSGNKVYQFEMTQ